MSRILGLDLGAYSVKALLLESNFRSYAVRAFTEVKLNPETGLRGALETLKAGGHLAADQVIVAMPGTSVATHVIALPFSDPRRIEATLGFEVEGQLPYDITEVVYDHQQLVTKPDGKSEILVGVLKTEEIENFLGMLKECGVDPRIVTTSALAYQNLLANGMLASASASPEESTTDSAVAVVDIGHERTSIAVGHSSGALEYARTFLGAGRDLTRAVANDFKVSLEDAQAWKETEGDVTLGEGVSTEAERAAAALLRGLAPIIREIRATIRAHFARFKKPLTRIYLTGGTSKLNGIAPMLARELAVEVVPLAAIPREAASTLAPDLDAVGSQAFALAMRGHGVARAARFNLRKGAYAFKGDLDYLRGKVSRLAAFAAVLLVLTFALVWSQFRALEMREQGLDNLLCSTTQRVLGKCQKDYLVALSMLRGQGVAGEVIPELSAVNLLAEITNRTDTVKVEVRYDEMEMQLQRIRLRGQTESFDGVDQLVSALKGYRCFQDIKRGRVQKNREGTHIQFELDINVQCAEVGKRAEG